MNRKLIVLAILSYIGFTLILHSYFYLEISKHELQVSGKATSVGQIGLCVNHAPELTHADCTQIPNRGFNYTCFLNASDIDGHDTDFQISYYDYINGYITDNLTIWNYENDGWYNFTRNETPVRTSMTVCVYDGTVCDNEFECEELNFCWNTPPTMTFDCNGTYFIDYVAYDCFINASDINNDSVSYDLRYYNSTNYLKIVNISGPGEFEFYRYDTLMRNKSFTVCAIDNTTCTNDRDCSSVPFDNYNNPPILISPIPNQTWMEDTTLQAFDLDDYFMDPDGDVLTYTYTENLLDNIEVYINPNNEVTFIPLTDYDGTEYIFFFAWDPYFANATSNNVSLIVTPDDDGSGSGGSGGGGGGGGGSVPSCIPQWYCRPWGPCEPDGYMHRNCYDLVNCSTTFGMPNTTEVCDFISTCYDGFKGPEEEGVDCGGPCPPCGNCYDNQCNNDEDCTKDLTETPDCGGPCLACIYEDEGTCYDSICNNKEDCTQGLADIPDCGGPCQECPEIESPASSKFLNYGLWFIMLSIILLIAYSSNKAYNYAKILWKKRKLKLYEQRLLLETKITESILESLKKLEQLIEKEDVEKLILMLSGLIRTYFKNLFKLSYEFTYEEIMTEIKSQQVSPSFKNVLKNFFERSLETEFSGKSVSKMEIRTMISEFRTILSLTSKEPLKTEEVKTKGKLNKIDKIFSSISTAEFALRNNKINEAYAIYIKLHKQFNSLNKEDKQKVHGFISRLYEEIRLSREKIELQIS